ncbi:MAG: response regulator transcription factor [Prevotella sp.]|nr:response regulator transcription factor [Prevotella sp.]
MKAVIIDDEKKAIEALSKKLEDYENVTLVGTAENGTKGILLVQEKQPDLLFLDVEMPDMTGLEFMEHMGHFAKKNCKVVIYTAHMNYMLPAFRGKAFDFLMKPIDDKELKKIIQRCIIEQDWHAEEAVNRDNEKLLFYTNATDFRVVNLQDVGLFQYNHEQRLWEVVAAGRQEPIRLKRSANNEALINIDERFVQVSQRFIININYLMEVSDNMCRFFPPFDHIDYVSIGRVFRKQLIERFNAF